MMNPFNEMILLPKDEYNRLTSQALHGSTPSMQKELEQLQNNHANLPDDQRNKLEQEIISKYTNHCKSSINQEEAESKASTASTVILDNDELLERHLKNFRNTNRLRAMSLYDHLKTYKSQWNNNGQFLTEDSNEAIPRSNIIDLIDYVTNTIKSSSKNAPAGFKEFVELLFRANTPEKYFSNIGLQRVNKMEKLIEAELKVAEDTDDDDVQQHENKRYATGSNAKRPRPSDEEEEEDSTWLNLK